MTFTKTMNVVVRRPDHVGEGEFDAALLVLMNESSKLITSDEGSCWVEFVELGPSALKAWAKDILRDDIDFAEQVLNRTCPCSDPPALDPVERMRQRAVRQVTKGPGGISDV